MSGASGSAFCPSTNLWSLIGAAWRPSHQSLIVNHRKHWKHLSVLQSLQLKSFSFPHDLLMIVVVFDVRSFHLEKIQFWNHRFSFCFIQIMVNLCALVYFIVCLFEYFFHWFNGTSLPFSDFIFYLLVWVTLTWINKKKIGAHFEFVQ